MCRLSGLFFIIYFLIGGCSKSPETSPSSPTQLFVPTAFTPNGDGLNDDFIVKASSTLIYYHIRIYDNGNIMVYESFEYIDTGWDGKANGQPEPAGSYLWSIEYQTAGASKITQNGYVQLIR